MASLAGLSSHRRPCTRCGHVAFSIVQIGASPKGVACPAPPRPTPQSGTRWTWPVDDFHRIAQGHHLDASCLAFGTRSSAIARRAKRTTIPLRRLHCASATNNPKHGQSLLQKVKKACCYLALPPRFGYRGQGYEKQQVSEPQSASCVRAGSSKSAQPVRHSIGARAYSFVPD